MLDKLFIGFTAMGNVRCFIWISLKDLFDLTRQENVLLTHKSKFKKRYNIWLSISVEACGFGYDNL